MKKAIKEIWKNRKQIMEGIKNSIIRDEFVEEVAKHRLSVCFACTHKDDEGDTCMVPGTAPCCNMCGCSLELKTRALSASCPDMKWKALISEEDEDKLDNLK